MRLRRCIQQKMLGMHWLTCINNQMKTGTMIQESRLMKGNKPVSLYRVMQE
ncbi:hypothetical protein SLEP1_g55869 [Rubroshorea leprosula]|uniref:Uncharacterized protein n=1 Tax=Rubroshorea leprosula TaxID=152421 RepID=A0AAV5MKJ0_9ROSI|nr:hypothetical protein SLEP1_g55869 [Rubroshorea leprosula]